MTAGQRNCHEAMGECMRAYSIDDVIEALRVHVAEQVDLRNSDERQDRLTNIAGYIARIQEQLSGMPRR